MEGCTDGWNKLSTVEEDIKTQRCGHAPLKMSREVKWQVCRQEAKNAFVSASLILFFFFWFLSSCYTETSELFFCWDRKQSVTSLQFASLLGETDCANNIMIMDDVINCLLRQLFLTSVSVTKCWRTNFTSPNNVDRLWARFAAFHLSSLMHSMIKAAPIWRHNY